MCPLRSSHYNAYFAEWVAKYKMPPMVLPHLPTCIVRVKGTTTVRCSWCYRRM